MNLDLNSYTPSKELEEVDLLNYVNARGWFDEYGNDKEKLNRHMKLVRKNIPEPDVPPEMLEKYKKRFNNVIDLAHKDYLDEQTKPGTWKKA